MQAWQKMCVQHVMTALIGGDMQIGQSNSSSSCSTESIFSNNFGLLLTSAQVQHNHKMQKNHNKKVT